MYLGCGRNVSDAFADQPSVGNRADRCICRCWLEIVLRHVDRSPGGKIMIEGQAWEECFEPKKGSVEMNEGDAFSPEQTDEGSGLEEVRREQEKLQTLREEFLAEKQKFWDEMTLLEKRLKEEQDRLKQENLFFEKKMDILKGGFAQLEADRKAFERDKIRMEEKQRIIREEAGMSGGGVKLFFQGVNNPLTLKKRYKDLIKIFHPDNLCGDTDVLQLINKEYERLREKIGWQKKA